MKKRYKLVLLSTLSIMTLVGQVSVEASEIANETKDTPFTVDIKESPVTLQKVTVPKFDIKAEVGKELIVHPKDNLVIEVTDNRKLKEASWDLMYELSAFNQDGKEVPISMSIGKGILQVGNKNLKPDLYEAKAVVLKEDESTSILRAKFLPNETTYGYVVSKENISLIVDKTVPEGTYKALQTVTLVQVPTTN